MFGSSVGFSESANVTVQLSMTSSDPKLQFQGHSTDQRRISRKRCMLRPNISSALCVYGGYTVFADNIHTYSNDTNVARSLSNRWASWLDNRHKTYRGDDCDLSGSCDVIGHVTNRFAIWYAISYWWSTGTKPLSATVIRDIRSQNMLMNIWTNGQTHQQTRRITIPSRGGNYCCVHL